MKKIMTKTAAVLSGMLMLFAAVSAGPGLAEAAEDLLGYMINIVDSIIFIYGLQSNLI